MPKKGSTLYNKLPGTKKRANYFLKAITKFTEGTCILQYKATFKCKITQKELSKQFRLMFSYKN